jgi:starch-binding outer membrane protein, SusD/RagB family
MKKLFYLLIIVFSLLGCSEDYLEKYPTTSMVIENFYKTPADATQAITAIYNTLLYDDWWSYYLISEAASDNCAGGAGQGDGGGYQLWDRGVQQTNSATANQDPWAIYFGGIYRANIYLEYQSRINWTGEEALQKQYEAEARFLRAYFHFYLARMFGEIPIVDHALAPDEQLSRTPAEELYSFMLEDLKFCVENGLSQPYGSMNGENWGRVTKWAAQSMIARVYLYYSGYYNDETLGDFTATDARAYLDDLIANSNHSLVPVYASLWRVPSYSELGSINQYAGEVNPEVVWAIRFDVSGNPAQWITRMVGPRNTNIDPYGQGWGTCTVMPGLWEAYDDGDTRKTATILSWADEGLFYDWNSASNGQAQYTGYNSKKYMLSSVGGTPEVANNWQQDGFEDYMIVRYADVLLMAAELHLLTGDNATALSYVNEVRERAFGDATHNLGSVSIDDIFTERRLELACEGLRWSDILRSCKGDFSKLNDILDYNDETDGGVDYSLTTDVFSLDVDGQNWADKKGLFQIPQSEIDLMGGLIEQNPGYTTD